MSVQILSDFTNIFMGIATLVLEIANECICDVIFT
jgi:hypothetical protein